jgi:uncharacterized protein YggE
MKTGDLYSNPDLVQFYDVENRWADDLEYLSSLMFPDSMNICRWISLSRAMLKWLGGGRNLAGVAVAEKVYGVDVVDSVGLVDFFRRCGRALGWILGIWLLVMPGVGVAQSASPTPGASVATAKPTPEGKISLEATARKRVPNTVADVVVAILAEGKTGDAVSGVLSQRSQTLLDYLRQQGVDRLTTEDVGFEPQIESARNGPDRIVGYTGHASVSFRTTPDKLGTVLSGSLEHGANTISQTQFTPTESEIDAARRDLAIEATKTALARADAIAQAAGVRVVQIEDINVASEQAVLPTFKAAGGLQAPARVVETAAGEQEISVRVSVQVGTRGSGE